MVCPTVTLPSEADCTGKHTSQNPLLYQEEGEVDFYILCEIDVYMDIYNSSHARERFRRTFIYKEGWMDIHMDGL